MPSSQPPTVPPVLTSSGNGEEQMLEAPVSENLGNLTPSARTSRTRVDLLMTSPPGEITTASPSIQDEEGDATPAQEPPREEVRSEPMVSLTILVLSGDRKKFTFHPDTTAGRVKEMIWSTWDASVSPISPQGILGISDGFFYPSKIGQKLPSPLIHPISVCYIWGEYCKMTTPWKASRGICPFDALG